MTRNDITVIDLAPVNSAIELHRLLMQKLGFPHWYGCNWDAFWDAITALVELPMTLQLNGWNDLSSRLPGEAHHMRSCLEDMQRQYPRFAAAVVYA